MPAWVRSLSLVAMPLDRGEDRFNSSQAEGTFQCNANEDSFACVQRCKRVLNGNGKRKYTDKQCADAATNRPHGFGD